MKHKKIRPHYNFENMSRWSVASLRKVRKELRDELVEEIQKRDALKAEIMFLQTQIANYREE